MIYIQISLLRYSGLNNVRRFSSWFLKRKVAYSFGSLENC